ncbi:histidine kinase [Bermanella marisrubri]|uniref:Predicted signal transduction protein n=1 Tax=Bermanella marisrubri TaxID=207949 RepID=Q1N445_9GAMM|nr:histidine kinase [Bermanella marisrubri]EAT13020.1 predicted signal transduction protein [Oceanobacter sp. RED65] [Bermanella marisrubri]QIZ82853.1 histidine kinase [Bermanella marisrubri]
MIDHNKIDASDFLPDFCQGRSLLGLTLFSQSLVIVLILLSSNLEEFGWQRFGLLAFYVQWVVLVCAALLCRFRELAPPLSLNPLMLVIFIIVVMTNLLISILSRWGMEQWFYQPLGVDWIVRNVIISAILSALLMHYFYVQMQNRLHARSELQARVQALQSRIRPHFLFNSMNIIASLIHEDPDTAEEAVEDLSALFRASLKEAGVEVTLAEELALCRKYLHIECLRLGPRLQCDWAVDAPHNIKIPLLTIQPLLENAIYHGISPDPNGGYIKVNITLIASTTTDHRLSVEVVNSLYCNHHHNKKSGNQMALQNIEHRLQALYGDSVKMQSEQCDQEYKMIIEYPVIVS